MVLTNAIYVTGIMAVIHLDDSSLGNKISNFNIYYLKQCNQELLLQYLHRKILPILILGKITSVKQHQELYGIGWDNILPGRCYGAVV